MDNDSNQKITSSQDQRPMKEGMYVFTNVQNLLHKYIVTITIALIVSFLFNLILISTLHVIAREKTKIVGIDEQGMPYKMKEINDNLKNLTNRKRFVEYFIEKLYHWNKDTYIRNVKTIIPLMANDIRGTYINMIDTNSYSKKVDEDNIQSLIDVEPINSEFKPYKEGYTIEVVATKIRIVEFIKRETIVKFIVSIRPCNYTEDNIWGLEVFEFSESPIKDLSTDENQKDDKNTN